MKVEEILKQLVSINTIKDKENNKIIDYIKNYLEKLDFLCETIGDDKKVLIAKTKIEPKFCFVGHTDTVDYNSKERNPFELEEKDGNLYGLGACDMKGGIAAILKAVSLIDFNKLSYGMMLVLTYDEEIGFGGINEFLDKKIKYPEYILVGEPTDNVPMNGSKGVIEYHFTFYGKKVHSSRIKESSNINCVKFLNELLELNEYFKKSECDEYEFKNSTMNYGIINGGDAINMVSDITKATCDFRITNKKEEFDYVKEFVEKTSKKYNMDYEIGIQILPFSNNSDLVNVYEKISKKKRKKFFGVSEASLVEGNRIILGPGPITAHEYDEHVSKKSLYECVDIYKEIINYICK